MHEKDKLNEIALRLISEMTHDDAGDVHPVDMLDDDELDDCDSCEIETDESEDDLKERRVVYRITAKGKRIKKIKCPAGRRVVTNGGIKKCVAITGAEKVTKRKAVRKAVRTKRAKGSGFAKRTSRLANKGRLKRRAMGL